VPAKTRILAVEDDEWCLEVKVILLDRVLPAIDEIELIWQLKCDERFRKIGSVSGVYYLRVIIISEPPPSREVKTLHLFE